MKQNGKVQKFMAEEYRRFAPLLDRYQWPWEAARWHELAFCFLVRLDDSPDAINLARETINIFANLDLLDIGRLAQISEKGEPNLTAPDFLFMAEIMKRQGYSQDQAERGIVTICEAAHTLQHRYGGKMQRYLRSYGDKIVKEFSRDFHFSRMSGDDVRFASKNWIQNVLNMPVALSNPNIEALAEQLGASASDLVEAADANDINVALMDDWAADYMRRQPMEGSHG